MSQSIYKKGDLVTVGNCLFVLEADVDAQYASVRGTIVGTAHSNGSFTIFERPEGTVHLQVHALVSAVPQLSNSIKEHYAEIDQIRKLLEKHGCSAQAPRATGLTDIYDKPLFQGDHVWLDYNGRSHHEGADNQFEIIWDSSAAAFKLKPIKLLKPSGFGDCGGNMFFSWVIEIDGDDYKYHLPPPKYLGDFRNILVKL